MKRTHIVTLGGVEIDINKGEIKIFLEEKMPKMDMCEIPKEAILFWGTEEEFVDFLQRAKNKFGHLYPSLAHTVVKKK
jgi:hypothetical protein